MAPPVRARPPEPAPKPDPWAGTSAAAPRARPRGSRDEGRSNLWYGGVAVLAFSILDILGYIATGYELTGLVWLPFLASMAGGGMVMAGSK